MRATTIFLLLVVAVIPSVSAWWLPGIPYCGNYMVEFGEQCDDGNYVGGDGCSGSCQYEGTCGDGQLDPGEECDDGNLAGGDGCSPVCRYPEFIKTSCYFLAYDRNLNNALPRVDIGNTSDICVARTDILKIRCDVQTDANRVDEVKVSYDVDIYAGGTMSRATRQETIYLNSNNLQVDDNKDYETYVKEISVGTNDQSMLIVSATTKVYYAPLFWFNRQESCTGSASSKEYTDAKGSCRVSFPNDAGFRLCYQSSDGCTRSATSYVCNKDDTSVTTYSYDGSLTCRQKPETTETGSCNYCEPKWVQCYPSLNGTSTGDPDLMRIAKCGTQNVVTITGETCYSEGTTAGGYRCEPTDIVYKETTGCCEETGLESDCSFTEVQEFKPVKSVDILMGEGGSVDRTFSKAGGRSLKSGTYSKIAEIPSDDVAPMVFDFDNDDANEIVTVATVGENVNIIMSQPTGIRKGTDVEVSVCSLNGCPDGSFTNNRLRLLGQPAMWGAEIFRGTIDFDTEWEDGTKGAGVAMLVEADGPPRYGPYFVAYRYVRPTQTAAGRWEREFSYQLGHTDYRFMSTGTDALFAENKGVLCGKFACFFQAGGYAFAVDLRKEGVVSWKGPVVKSKDLFSQFTYDVASRNLSQEFGAPVMPALSTLHASGSLDGDGVVIYPGEKDTGGGPKSGIYLCDLNLFECVFYSLSDLTEDSVFGLKRMQQLTTYSAGSPRRDYVAIPTIA